MADSVNISIQPGNVRISRVADNSTIFSTDYNYLVYDPAGTIKFPVSPTMSSLNGNLTWQFNGHQVVIQNTYYAAGAKVFDTYQLPMTSCAPYATVVADSFTDVEVSNVESPYSSV